MPKEDCKYWDKCYQRNEQHLQKYNHPTKKINNNNEHNKKEDNSETIAKKETATTKTNETPQNVAPKRRASAEQKTATEQKAESDTQNTSGCSGSSKNNSMEETSQDKYETAELREEAISNISGKNYMEILEKRIRLSVKQEYENLCKSNEFIRHKFLVEMPPDFYAFWDFVNTLKKDTTNMEAIKYLDKQFQLQLVGPFEFLAGRFHDAKICEPGDYLRHCRFYYDPPEFQTVFVRRGTGVHYGYWRDVPQDKEHLLLARNDAKSNCEFQFIAGNIFDAFLHYLDKDFVGTPFTAAEVSTTKKALQKYLDDNSLELDKLEALTKARNKNVVTKSFHRAGLVVPFDRKTQQGYRPLNASDAELKKMLKLFEEKDNKSADTVSTEEDDDNDIIKKAVLEKLQPVANAANIAVDECDFGTALELGIDLFCSGYKELHMLITSLLVPAYSMLKRPQFIAIAKAHMEKRRRDLNVNMFDNMN